MTNRQMIVLAILSIGVSLTLGAIDSETRSLGDLLALQNVPALAIFAALAFGILATLWLGTGSVVRRIRVRRDH